MENAAEEGVNGDPTRGEFLAPFIPCHMPPPIAPIANAPPKSFRMTQGLGKEHNKDRAIMILSECSPGVSCMVRMRH